MDQMACSVGNMVHIDFENPQEPIVNPIDFDFEKSGYSLCIVDTKGSHADLTDDYAAIPQEMKAIAACFDKEVLRDICLEDIFTNMNRLRAQVNDRAILRAIHFFEENIRVQQEVAALKADNFPEFLETIQASGNSSYKYLQNIYTPCDIEHQNVSIALAASDCILGDNGVSRIHGGGFAGTIQAFVNNEFVDTYKQEMDHIFGIGFCNILKIRKYGGVRVL
jgi:galactokinase